MSAFCLCCFLFYSAKLANGDVFSAVADLAQVVPTEKALIDLLGNFIKSEETKLNLLKRYYESFQKHNKISEDPERYVSNPINAFTLIKRLVSDWKAIEALIIDEETLARVKMIKDTIIFPDYEDLHGAALAMKRLQETYNLSTSSLARGEIRGIKYSPEMSASDCFVMGKTLYEDEYFHHAEEWLMEANDLVEEEEYHTVSKDEILDHLTNSVLKQNLIKPASSITNKLQEALKSVRKSKGKDIVKGEKPTEKQKDIDYFARYYEQDKEISGNISLAEMTNIINQLCIGDLTNPQAHLSSLKCRYLSETHPFLLIAPIKIEEAYHNPHILIFHDVVTESEITTFKEMTMARYSRARVIDVQTGESIIDNYRLSKSSWLEDVEHQYLKSLTRRMEDMTGLSMRTAESTIVVNYGIGGHYGPHFDYFSNINFSNAHNGNRIATLLFYLSDVEMGGATVFPLLRVSVKPKKGSALFWYNLKPDGGIDKKSLHQACPVLLGSKWVANKWIRERDQEFRRPCPK